jgi:hypothetical protein
MRATAPRKNKMPAMPTSAIVNNQNLFCRRQLPHKAAKKPMITDEMIHGAPRFLMSSSTGPYFGNEIFNSWTRAQAERR